MSTCPTYAVRSIGACGSDGRISANADLDDSADEATAQSTLSVRD